MIPAVQERADASDAVGPHTANEDAAVVEALRAGDEAAFAALVDRYHRAMVHVALAHVHDYAVAEEVAQEAWLGVLRGLAHFEVRTSLKAWIFRIVRNRAKTRAAQEARCRPFSRLLDTESDSESDSESAAPPEWFDPSGGYWVSAPTQWDELPEGSLLAAEANATLREALAALPPVQRAVISLRDVQGWGATEVCEALGLSEANQRVLLHRARTRLRHALAQRLAVA